jgi:hypothetical protein
LTNHSQYKDIVAGDIIHIDTPKRYFGLVLDPGKPTNSSWSHLALERRNVTILWVAFCTNDPPFKIVYEIFDLEIYECIKCER